jgi:hypothetical protein
MALDVADFLKADKLVEEYKYSWFIYDKYLFEKEKYVEKYHEIKREKLDSDKKIIDKFVKLLAAFDIEKAKIYYESNIKIIYQKESLTQDFKYIITIKYNNSHSYFV